MNVRQSLVLLIATSFILFSNLMPYAEDRRSFFEDIKFGRIAAVQAGLEEGIDPNAVDYDGRSALMYGAERGQLSVVRILVEKGADVNLKSIRGKTALMTAAANAQHDVVSYFLDKGADINATDDDGGTALMSVAGRDRLFGQVRDYSATTNLLLERGADVNAKTNVGMTASMYAAESGNSLVLDLILRKGPILNERNGNKQTILMLAAQRGDSDIVGLLLAAGADPSEQDQNGKTALMYAAAQGNLQNIGALTREPQLVNAKDSDGMTALHYAVSGGHPKAVKMLLDLGSVPNDQDNMGRTPLHIAAFYNDGQSVNRLLEAGASLSIENEHGRTALETAAAEGNLAALLSFRAQGADINASSFRGQTALLTAVINDRQYAVEFLIDQLDADVDRANSSGMTPLLMAIDQKNEPLVRTLLDRNAEISGKALMLASSNASLTNLLKNALQSRQAPIESTAHTIFFATNRTSNPETSSSEDEMYYKNGQPNMTSGGPTLPAREWHLGRVTVEIPSKHPRGRLEGRLQNPPQEMSSQQLFSAIAYEADKNRRPIFLFIHGFNVSFTEGVKRVGQLARDFKSHSIPLIFSWPAKSNVGVIDAPHYFSDLRNSDASVGQLVQFLQDMRNSLGSRPIDLVAHSMGSNLLMNALHTIRLSQPKRTGRDMFGCSSLNPFREVILAAPDIDVEKFAQMVREFEQPQSCKPYQKLTLYGSDRDLALMTSMNVWGGWRAGAGGRNLLVMENLIESIDATDVHTEWLGHSYYGNSHRLLDDMFYIIDRSLRPDNRAGLERRGGSGSPSWQFVPVAD